ncbi:hypothetical protein MAR_000968, partial [Mya arenaria]
MTEQLEVAVKAGRIDVVNGFLSTLAENKSEENAALLKSILTTACYDGSSLLHIASKEDQFDIVRALLSTGADPTVKDLDGHFPYQLKQLIESGVGVNFSDAKESANTPLHWAASFADINTVRCLCGLENRQKCAGMTCYELGEGKPEVLDVLNNPPPILDVGIEGVNREKMTPLPEYMPISIVTGGWL